MMPGELLLWSTYWPSAPNEIGAILPEMLEEVQEDERPDVTIPQATDILFKSTSQVMM